MFWIAQWLISAEYRYFYSSKLRVIRTDTRNVVSLILYAIEIGEPFTMVNLFMSEFLFLQPNVFLIFEKFILTRCGQIIPLLSPHNLIDVSLLFWRLNLRSRTIYWLFPVAICIIVMSWPRCFLMSLNVILQVTTLLSISFFGLSFVVIFLIVLFQNLVFDVLFFNLITLNTIRYDFMTASIHLAYLHLST